MEVASVLHSIPGRIRLRVPSLRNNPAAAALLEARLSILPAVLNVESNVVTGTLVLHHEPAAHEALETAVDELLPSLESTAASAGIAGAAAPTAPPSDTTKEAAPEAPPAGDNGAAVEDDDVSAWDRLFEQVGGITSAFKPGGQGARKYVPLAFAALGAADLLRRVVKKQGIPLPVWYSLLWCAYGTWGYLSQRDAHKDIATDLRDLDPDLDPDVAQPGPDGGE